LATFNMSLDEKRETATLAIQEHPLAIVPMNADDLTNLIAMLAHVRSQMAPAVPAEWTSNEPVNANFDPSWNLLRETMHGGSLLHVRDPGLGWLHIFFPPERALKIAELLTAQANQVNAEKAIAAAVTVN
jgi:hypothetical protein